MRSLLAVLAVLASSAVWAQPARSLAPIVAGSSGIVTLGPGDYTLDDVLVLDGEWHFAGAGRDETRIVSRGGFAALVFVGRGSVTLEGITFVRDAGVGGDLVGVAGDIRLTVDGCRFVGSVGSPGAVRSAVGIVVIHAAASSVIRDSEFRDAVVGIGIGSQNGVSIERVTVLGMAEVGIHVYEDGRATVRETVATGNARGIFATERARLTVERSRVVDSTLAGILFRDASAGRVSDSTVQGTDGPGFAVGGTATPEINGNRVVANGVGLWIFDAARPALESNVIEDNEADGVAYFDLAGGTATLNTLAGNGRFGMSLEGDADPSLWANTLRAKGSSGIDYRGASAGSANANTCEGYFPGITLWQAAAPTIGTNGCTVVDQRPADPMVLLVPVPGANGR